MTERRSNTRSTADCVTRSNPRPHLAEGGRLVVARHDEKWGELSSGHLAPFRETELLTPW
jgi:hypothetical protein